MKHLSAQELTQKGEGSKVTLEGWVDTVRNQGKILFVVLRNEHGLFQGVALKKDESVFATGKKLTSESVIRMSGAIQVQKAAPQGVEILLESIKLLSKADAQLPIPISQHAENEADLQNRLDWRWIDLRHPNKRLVRLGQPWSRLLVTTGQKITSSRFTHQNYSAPRVKVLRSFLS